MKISILIGPGEVKKRETLLKIKSGYDSESTNVVNLKSESLDRLRNALNAISLFESGSSRLVIAENAPDSLDPRELRSSDQNLELVILPSTNSVASTLIKNAKEQKSIKILNFEAEGEISAFPYLDYLIEKNVLAHLELNKLMEEYGSQYILTMIYYLLRRNFLPQKSSFMSSKIKKQSVKYTSSDWPKLYKLVIETDFKIKTGSLPEDLALSALTQKIISF